ncbi:TrmB family transcriptional regulator [Natronosalvus vescus]|uniref:TrmB family transcriptional regulator n=1 Tax=Natronosalvus vescus TaxID=2953881 RepID=UPI0020904D82|nr:helix-turn-helix domain-containing protein [Natronosalvus vescus]
MDADHVDELTTLGLSSYEARAYATLVENGVMTADDVASTADVPLGRIYDVLNTLVERSLVRADDGRPRTYTHVDPSVAIDRLLERRQSELEAKHSEYERTAATARQVLTELTDRDQTDQFAASALHDDAARELVLEQFVRATDTIRIGLTDVPFEPAYRDSYIGQLEECAHAGITVRILGGTIDDRSNDVARLYDAGVRFRRIERDPARRVVVIDGREACVEVLDPFQATNRLAVVNFRDEAVATDLAARFDEYWRRAGPGL